MVSSIKNVDESFYSQARQKYNNVSSEIKKLKISLAKLSLNTYDVNSIISNRLEKLQEALHLIGDDDVDIISGIQTDVDKFCQEGYGNEVIRMFGETPKTDNEYDFDEVFSIVESKAKKIFNKSHHRLRQEFVQYSTLKSSLCKQINNDVNNHINEEVGDQTLVDAKKRIFHAFFDVGKLSYISDYLEDDFASKFTSVLNADGCFDELASTFATLYNFKLDIKEHLRAIIEGAINEGSHFDAFGEDGFATYENALRSFLYSLCEIEMNAKAYLNDEAFERTINQVQTNVDTAFMNIVHMADIDDLHQTDTYKQLWAFYYKHMDKIFKDDDSAIKQGVVEQWKSLIK